MSFKFVHPTKLLEQTMCKTKLLQRLILAYYRPIVQKEVALATAQKHHEILCVGGGYFPCTAILFHQLSGARVTVIDNDVDAIKRSTKLIEKLGLQSHVVVKHTDGMDVSGNDFDIIHIAMQISPKEKVFAQIHSTMRKNAKIMVRTPKEHLQRGYQPFKDSCGEMSNVRMPSFSNIEKTRLYVR